MPYSSLCNIVAERPTFVRELQNEAVGEAEVNETVRDASGEIGEEIMDASKSTRGRRLAERQRCEDRVATERRSRVSAWR